MRCDIEILAEVLKCFVDYSHCKGVIYDGKLYTERSNIWIREEHIETEWDKDVECNGSEDCPAPEIFVKRSELTLVLDINHSGSVSEKVNELALKASEIVFDGELILRNVSGENFDHRGSNHLKIFVPFQKEIRLKDPSILDLVRGIFEIKSHLFDYWYELFCNVTLHGNVLEANFDHGS